MSKSKAADRAWAAGFFDGEGSISLMWKRHQRGRNGSERRWFVLQISVTNTDRSALERFQEIVGAGNIYTRKRIEERRQIFTFHASHRAAETILLAIEPFVVSKRGQVLLALESRKLGQLKPYDSVSPESFARLVEIENEIKALNGRNYQKRMASLSDRANPYVEV